MNAHALAQVLVALSSVLIVGRVLSVLFRRLGQPPVIGEVVAGIVLGPTVLGEIWPEAAAFILPASVAPFLSVIAQLGVILYMFLIGLELNPGVLRARATLIISSASMALPLAMGLGLAVALYPRFAGPTMSLAGFALFIGVATAITAFPVLARILTDRQMQRTPLGMLALACAAINDVTAWCLLALAVGVAQAQFGGAMLVVAMAMGYIVFMFLIVRPIARRWSARLNQDAITSAVLACVFAALLLSALATEAIGIHAIFGAFLFGAVIPHESPLARSLPHKLEELVTVLLLPAFFALTGMRTQLGLLAGTEEWLLCGAIIVVATVGKFGGTLMAARHTGLGWSEAAALAALMNTRGLMELIALNIALDMEIISPSLFAMMVLMTLVTTMAAAPILELLTNKAERTRTIESA